MSFSSEPNALALVITACERIAELMSYIAAAAAIVLWVFVCLGSGMRYVIGAPLDFSEELVGLLFCAMAFLAMPQAMVQGRHINVTIVTEALPRRARRAADALALMVLVAFVALFAFESGRFAAFSFRINSRSDAASLTLYPWMSVMPVCVALLGLLGIFRYIRHARGPLPSDTENPRHGVADPS